MTDPAAPARRPWLAAADLLVGASLLAGVWIALPARWWPVDLCATAVALALVVSGVGLARGASWSRRAGLVAGALALALGVTLTSALALTAATLSGLYGPVGAGGAIILAVVAGLVVPYLVALPLAQLVALGRR